MPANSKAKLKCPPRYEIQWEGASGHVWYKKIRQQWGAEKGLGIL